MAKSKSEDIRQEILLFVARKRRYVTIEEICKNLNLSRPTVKKYVGKLIEEEWLEEER